MAKLTESPEVARETLKGKISMKFHSEGLGRILGDDGKEYAFDFTQVVGQDQEFARLRVGDSVTFNRIDPLPGKKLNPRRMAAENVAIYTEGETANTTVVPEIKDRVDGLLEDTENMESATGTVKTIKQDGHDGRGRAVGYGFITTETGEDVFFHSDKTVGGLEVFKTFSRGTELSFVIERSPKGPIARNIVAKTTEETQV